MFLPFRFHEWSVWSFFNTYEGIEGRFKKKKYFALFLSFFCLSCTVFLIFYYLALCFSLSFVYLVFSSSLTHYIFFSLFQSSFPNFYSPPSSSISPFPLHSFTHTHYLSLFSSLSLPFLTFRFLFVSLLRTIFILYWTRFYLMHF